MLCTAWLRETRCGSRWRVSSVAIVRSGTSSTNRSSSGGVRPRWRTPSRSCSTTTCSPPNIAGAAFVGVAFELHRERQQRLVVVVAAGERVGRDHAGHARGSRQSEPSSDRWPVGLDVDLEADRGRDGGHVVERERCPPGHERDRILGRRLWVVAEGEAQAQRPVERDAEAIESRSEVGGGSRYLDGDAGCAHGSSVWARPGAGNETRATAADFARGGQGRSGFAQNPRNRTQSAIPASATGRTLVYTECGYRRWPSGQRGPTVGGFRWKTLSCSAACVPRLAR